MWSLTRDELALKGRNVLLNPRSSAFDAFFLLVV